MLLPVTDTNAINYVKSNAVLFSIIVPVYNAEKYIAECLNSILNQAFSDFEVIIVDDGSTDESGNICDDFGFKSDKVHVIHQRNAGQLSARLAGLQRAVGEYIWFIDADDYIFEGSLQRLCDYTLACNCDVVLFDCHDDVIQDNHYVLNIENNKIYYKEDKHVILGIVCQNDSLNPLWRKVFKKRLVHLHEDFFAIQNLCAGVDFIISVPIYLRAESIIYMHETLYFYRYNENSITHTYHPDFYDNRKQLHQYLCYYLGNQFASAPVILRRRFLQTVVRQAIYLIAYGYENKYEKLQIIANDDYWREYYKLEKAALAVKPRIICWLLYHRQIWVFRFIGEYFIRLYLAVRRIAYKDYIRKVLG